MNLLSKLPAFFLVLFLLNSCKDEDKNLNVNVAIKSLINSNEVMTNKFYKLKDNDSISISRLDYYLQHIELSHLKNTALKLDTIMLFSLKNSKHSAFKTSQNMSNSIDSFSLLSGLDQLTNQSDPTKFNADHPLSSWKNMYWTMSSKYRYIVIEGKFKNAAGLETNFSYHTGLDFKHYAKLPTNLSLSEGDNNLVLALNIEKIFYPNSQNNVNYNAGETQAHADPNDLILTDKIAKNFSQAFSLTKQ